MTPRIFTVNILRDYCILDFDKIFTMVLVLWLMHNEIDQLIPQKHNETYLPEKNKYKIQVVGNKSMLVLKLFIYSKAWKDLRS